MSEWKLTEEQTRTKIAELLDLCNDARMNMWMFSGITAGVLDGDLVEKLAIEELPKRSHEVQRYWLGACNCHGQLN